MSFLFTCCDTDNVLTILSKSKPFGLFLLSILILMAYPLLCLARIVDLDKIIYLFVVYLVSYLVTFLQLGINLFFVILWWLTWTNANDLCLSTVPALNLHKTLPSI